MTNTRKMTSLAAAIVVLFHSLSDNDRNDVLDNINGDNAEGFAISPGAVDQQQNAPAASTAPTNNDLDGDGVPWDARIHASTKTRTQKGVWTKKKGIDDATYASITASLKGTAAAPATGASTPSLPPPPGAPSAPSLPPPPAAPQAPEFADLVTLLTQQTHSPDNPTGRLTAQWISDTLKHYGVPSGLLPDAAANPALCATIAAGVRQLLGIAA